MFSIFKIRSTAASAQPLAEIHVTDRQREECDRDHNPKQIFHDVFPLIPGGNAQELLDKNRHKVGIKNL
jgi:hypothetical protein